jgi:hypothetical protein
MRQWLEQNSNKDAQGAGIALKRALLTRAMHLRMMMAYR